MSYYLKGANSNVLIREENTSEALKYLSHYFEAEKDEDGNIIDLKPFDLKYNFEDALQECAALFENGSHIDCIGENGEVFRLLFRDGKMYDISGTILYPEDEDAQIEVNSLEQRLSAGLLETF